MLYYNKYLLICSNHLILSCDVDNTFISNFLNKSNKQKFIDFCIPKLRGVCWGKGV